MFDCSKVGAAPFYTGIHGWHRTQTQRVALSRPVDEGGAKSNGPDGPWDFMRPAQRHHTSTLW